MKISELKVEEIEVGMRIKSCVSDRMATIVEIDRNDDDYAWVLWDGETSSYSGFYGNTCECEVECWTQEEIDAAHARAVEVREAIGWK